MNIAGSGFGAGPAGVVFDDFEGGTDHSPIKTGAGSAVVGQWNAILNLVYYTDDYSRSGSLALESNWTTGWYTNWVERTFPSGTSEVYGVWWVRTPTGNFPGEGNPDKINWKHIWIMGDDSVQDDDVVIVFLGDDAIIAIGGNCGTQTTYTDWTVLGKYNRGDWLRMSFYVKGGYTDGAYNLRILHQNGTSGSFSVQNARTWGHQQGDSYGLPRQYERMRFNAFGRENTPNSYTGFDDCYSAYGPNCRARVEIGNASTYNNCTRLAICPTTSWSDTSIAAVCSLGGLSGGAWYLFVVDANGSASNGYLLPQETYTLTVNSGSGDGDCYSGQVVAVAADAAPSGMIFHRWMGDTAGLASATAASTTYTMPAHSAAITGTYRVALSYQLTVHSGTGSGTYLESSVVAISANPAPSGYVFGSWTGDAAYVANTHAASTTVTIPQADVQVTASYNLPFQTVKFREGGGSGYVNVTFDDTWIAFSPVDDNSHGNDTYNGIIATTGKASLIAVKDLFARLPKTTGGCQIQIGQAKLHLFRYNAGSSSNVIGIHRLTTNWLPGSAGTNENNVSGQHAVKSADTHWAGGNFSSGDYDTSVVSTGAWGDNYVQELVYTVTNQVSDIYSAAVNYGLVVKANGSISGSASESTDGPRPILEIAYAYVPISYSLTMNSGTGGGTYTQGTVVNIAANAAASGMAFDKWIGNTANIANVNASSTTLTMPAAAVSVTATYVPVYQLTVNSGTGDGQYKAGTVVAIAADAAPSGMEFDAWTGDVATVADPSAAATTITMPASAAEVTATYSVVLPPLLGDLNGDGFVGQGDLNIVLSQWGRGAPPHEPITDPRADANHDNFVGQGDLDIVLADWGKGTRP